MDLFYCLSVRMVSFYSSGHISTALCNTITLSEAVSFGFKFDTWSG